MGQRFLGLADIYNPSACRRQKCMEHYGFVWLCFQWLQIETPTEETKEVKEVKEVKANVVRDRSRSCCFRHVAFRKSGNDIHALTHWLCFKHGFVWSKEPKACRHLLLLPRSIGIYSANEIAYCFCGGLDIVGLVRLSTTWSFAEWFYDWGMTSIV